YDGNLTTYYNNTANNVFGCRLRGQPNIANEECGFGYTSIAVELSLLPTVTMFSNQMQFVVPFTNFTGYARCNCDAFFNATYPRYSWIATPTNSCEPFCPPLVNFQTFTRNGQRIRLCTNCEQFGYTTNPITNRCNTGSCVAPGSVWNIT